MLPFLVDLGPGGEQPFDYVNQFMYMPAVVLAHGLDGDANLDGTVDINDLTIVLANYGRTGMGWVQGEFTGDGTVDINDLTIVLAQYGQSLAASAGARQPLRHARAVHVAADGCRTAGLAGLRLAEAGSFTVSTGRSCNNVLGLRHQQHPQIWYPSDQEDTVKAVLRRRGCGTRGVCSFLPSVCCQRARLWAGTHPARAERVFRLLFHESRDICNEMLGHRLQWNCDFGFRIS